MKVRIWMERMVILDLLMVALLLFVRGFVEPAVEAHSAAVVQAGQLADEMQGWIETRTEARNDTGQPLTQGLCLQLRHLCASSTAISAV